MRRVRRRPAPPEKRRRRVHEHRRRRVAAIDRRGVDDRLECGSDLPVRLRRAVELAALEAVAADHRRIWPVRLSIARTAPSTAGGCSSVPVAAVRRSRSTVSETCLDEIAGRDELRGVRLARPRDSPSCRSSPGACPRARRSTRPRRPADDRRHDVADGHRVIPARMLERLDGVAFGDDVAARLAEAAPLVDAAEPVVEARGWPPPAAVRRARSGPTGRSRTAASRRTGSRAPCALPRGSTARSELLGRRRRRAARSAAPWRLRPPCGVMKPLLGHPIEHVVRGAACARSMFTYGLCATCPGGCPAMSRRLVERQVLCRLAEVDPRRGLDAVRAVAEVHLVGVEREDLAASCSASRSGSRRSLP